MREGGEERKKGRMHRWIKKRKKMSGTEGGRRRRAARDAGIK